MGAALLVRPTPAEAEEGHHRRLASALGAARLARVAAGDGTIAEVFTPLPVAALFEPDPALRAAMAERQELYGRLYGALKAVRTG